MRCRTGSFVITFCVLTCISATNSSTAEIPWQYTASESPKAPSIASKVWKSEVTRTLIAGVALTRLSMQFDPDARHEAATKSWAHSEMVEVGESYADGACLAGLTAVTWGYGALAGNDRLRETGWYMAKGLVLDAVIVTALKSAVGRTRPDGSDTRSFPSGHTSTAFTTATVLSRRHGWKIGLPAYGLASMAAVARIEDDRHYLSDVVAGAVLGIAVGKFITPKSKPEESGWQVVASPSKVGLRLKF